MRQALVLGLGNVLWSDEGFGVRCIEALAAGWQAPPGVEFLDGATLGLQLLPYVEDSRRLIVIDAFDLGGAPGTLHVREGAAVLGTLGASHSSLRQAGFHEVLACAALQRRLPEKLVLIGVQPVELEDFGGGLRPAVRAQVAHAAELACERLARWGLHARPRTLPLPDASIAPPVARLA